MKSKEEKNRCYYKKISKKEIGDHKDDHKDNYKEIFEELVAERFDEIKKSIHEINQNDILLIYCFKGNTFRKSFHDFNDDIELYKKIKPGQMNQEEAKNLLNVFKSNLNQISKGRFKSEEQKFRINFY